MFKKVLPVLVLGSFLAVLLVPATALAAECRNCVDPPSSPSSCTCGANVLNREGGLYCYNETVYTSKSACQSVMAAAGGTSGAGWTEQTLYGFIDRIGNIIFTIALAIAGIFLVVAGIFFVTASGNPEQVNKARQMLVNALIGVAVAVAAKGLVALIQNIVPAAPAF